MTPVALDITDPQRVAEAAQRWQTSWRHLTADGKVAELTDPSEANQTRAFPPPVEAADTAT